MRRSAQLSVPGATAGLPTPAPMLSVPIEPGFVAIIIGPLTMPPSAIVSVPVPSLPMFTPKLLLQVEPAPVTVTVPREPANSPMLAVLGVSLMTVPPFAIVSVPVPKAPTLSPPLGPLIQAGAWAGHRHRAGRAGRQSDGAAAAAVHRAAVLDGKRAHAHAADHDVLRHSSIWSPRRSPSPCPATPGKFANNPPEIGHRPAVLDCEHSCPVDGQIQSSSARGLNYGRM